MLNWNLIKGLTSPVPLRTLDLEPTHIKGDLYQFGPHEFVHVGRRKADVDASPELFGNIFYWAPTIGAAVRVDQRDIAQDDGSLLCPPKELLLDGWRWSYADIVEACQRGDFGPTKTFQLSTGQQRIGRHVAVGNFSFYFRSDDDQAENAFAVAVDIRGIRWRLCG